MRLHPLEINVSVNYAHLSINSVRRENVLELCRRGDVGPQRTCGISTIDSAPDPQQITLRLDDLSAAIRTVEVWGEVEQQDTVSSQRASGASAKAEAAVSSRAHLGVSVGRTDGQL
jgi:hypothetical protein